MLVLIVVTTMAAHFIFVGYVIVGGFLALRWPRTIWLHLGAVAWAAANAYLNVPCPLTGVERWARRAGGMAPLPPAGFIDHYITGVFYPRGAATAVELAAFAVVAASWAVYAYRQHNRDRTGPRPVER